MAFYTLFDDEVPGEGTVTTEWRTFLHPPDYVALQSSFVYDSGGTTCKVYLQTSFDEGATPIDVVCHAFAQTTAKKVSVVVPGIAPASQGFSPTDGSLSDNTVVNGVVGRSWRLKIVVAGSYTDSFLTVKAEYLR